MSRGTGQQCDVTAAPTAGTGSPTHGSLGLSSTQIDKLNTNRRTAVSLSCRRCTHSPPGHTAGATCRQHDRHVAHPRCRSPRSEGQRGAARSAPHPLPTARPNPSGAGTRGGRPALTDADSSAVQDRLGVPHGGTDRRAARLFCRAAGSKLPPVPPRAPTANRSARAELGADRGGPCPRGGCRSTAAPRSLRAAPPARPHLALGALDARAAGMRLHEAFSAVPAL